MTPIRSRPRIVVLGRRASRLRRACGVLFVAMATGCAARGELRRPAAGTLPPGSPLLDVTLADGDAWLRHHLMSGDYARAIELLENPAVVGGDGLVRDLQAGLLLHRAGEYALSDAALARAEAEIERRYTRSVSRGALALGINDGTMAYTAPPAERAMIPFYRILNHLALGDTEGAAVEARKANAISASDPAAGESRCAEAGMLAYLAGTVQSAAGERNDALVSLRRAEASFIDCDGALAPPRHFGADLHLAASRAGVSEVADSAWARYGLADHPTGGGDVLIVVEEGFVAHRSPQEIHVPIFPAEIDGLDSGDADAVAAAAARVTARLLENFVERAVWGRSVDDLQWVRWAHSLSGAYVMRLAWPASRHEPSAPAGIRVLVGDSEHPVTRVGEISSLLQHDLEARRPAMLTRLVARGLVKYLTTRELERRVEEEGGELAGFLAGRVANLAANELERADTRSWSLLPDRVSIARLRLPAGTHHIRVETIGEGGGLLRTSDLGEVTVVDGGRVTLTTHVWGN